MSHHANQGNLTLPNQENWTGKLGVILAVAGSAVGLGNFLRFPGQAVNNGGGAFMIPYLLSFLLLGIPICWCEWTMGRLGGRHGQNSPPGIYYCVWRSPIARVLGVIGMMIPVVIFMYYIFIEAWCLTYAIEFLRGSFTQLFADATQGVTGHQEKVDAVVAAAGGHFAGTFGFAADGQVFTGGFVRWAVLISFAVNFYVIYRGVTRGIEWFCKYAMPLLIVCALIILVRALTLKNITTGLGFMWNPDWDKLRDPQVWMAASSQIFFSLSVGFGLILTYASYLRSDDDVVLSSLTASSINEFCEVILAGLIIVPVAFIFLGANAAKQGTFGLGFVTIPSIMHFMPGGPFWGQLFGTMWFGLLTLAAITSSLSMLQPAIAFLEDGFGLKRHGSTTILCLVTLAGALPIIYFSKDAWVLDITDFWVGNFMIFIGATAMVIVFGWVVGVDQGLAEAARGAELAIPRVFRYIIKYVTPTFLLIVFAAWLYYSAPSYFNAMRPGAERYRAARAVYEDVARQHFTSQGNEAPEAIDAKVTALLGESGVPAVESLPEWLASVQDQAQLAGEAAHRKAVVGLAVVCCLGGFLAVLILVTEIAFRRRMGAAIDTARTQLAAEGA